MFTLKREIDASLYLYLSSIIDASNCILNQKNYVSEEAETEISEMINCVNKRFEVEKAVTLIDFDGSLIVFNNSEEFKLFWNKEASKSFSLVYDKVNSILPN